MTPFEAFAVDLARAAAAVTLPLFRTDCGEEDKGGPGAFDPVTRADRDAEAAMRRLIAERFPDHGVIGEEYGEDRPDADHVWVLDPVDGTRAFVAGLPLWTSLIALRHEGRPVTGVIAQPVLDEIFLGGPSGAVLLKGSEEPCALRTRACPSLNDAVIATTDPDIFTGAELGAWTQVRAAARLARLGCDAYAYAMVAGRIDLVAETSLKPWDWSALVPVVEAAGGKVVNWRGQATDDKGQVLAVGDAALIDQALVTLRRAAL